MKNTNARRADLAALRPGFDREDVAALSDQLIAEGDAEWRRRGEYMALLIDSGSSAWTVRREWSRWAHHGAILTILRIRLLMAQDEFENVVRRNRYRPDSVGEAIRMASRVLDVAIRGCFGSGAAAKMVREDSLRILLRNVEANP